jgi:hypothetical protein
MKIKHSLMKVAKENRERYGRNRFRIEGLFGSIKLKVREAFRVVKIFI